MKKLFYITFILSLTILRLIPDEALAIHENYRLLQLLYTKYAPCEYEIITTKKIIVTSQEDLTQSTFKGPGRANMHFSGSFAATLRTQGGIQIGSTAGPGFLSAIVGKDKTRSITLSQNYLVQMTTDHNYVLYARLRYEYQEFEIKRTRDGVIVDRGQSKRPIGLMCSYYTEPKETTLQEDMEKEQTAGTLQLI